MKYKKIKYLNLYYYNLILTGISLGFFFLCISTSSAQVHALKFSFEKDTLIVKPGETFSNMLVITNEQGKEIVLERLHDDFNETALLKLPDTISLAAGQVKRIPVKFFANSSTIKSSSQLFTASYHNVDPSDGRDYFSEFIVVLDARLGLVFETLSNELYLGQFSNSTDLDLKVHNTGLVPLSLTLEFEDIPKGLKFDFDNDQILLQPGELRMISIKATNVGVSSRKADFAVKIKGVDLHGNTIAYKDIRIMSLVHNRNLVLRDQENYYTNRPNVLNFSYVNSNSFSSMQLMGTGRYKWNDSKEVGYNLNLNSYLKSNSKYNLTNTYVYLKTDHWLAHLGTISDSYGFNVNGKGAKVVYNLDKTRSIGLTAIDNDITLLSDNNTWKRGGYTVVATYREATPAQENLQVVLLNSKEEYSHLNTTLFTVKKYILKFDEHALIGNGGISYQTATEFRKQSKTGYSVGMDYNWMSAKKSNTGNLSFFSSSPYYGGINKGLFLLNGNINIALSDKESIAGSLGIQSNRPKFFGTSPSIVSVGRLNYSDQQIYEVGYRNKLGRNYNLGVFPYYFNQSMASRITMGDENPIVDWISKSYRAKLLFNFRYVDHSFSLVSDHGHTFENTSNKPTAPFYSARVNASYNFREWGITAYYQQNPYYLSDALVNAGGKKYNIFTVGPTGAYVSRNNKISTNYSLSYNYYGYNKTENYMLNIYGRWNVNNDWAVTGSANYGINKYTMMTRYNPEKGVNHVDPIVQWGDTELYTSRQFRMGIEKRIGRAWNLSERKLVYVCFSDLNRNGIRDKGEPYISDVVLFLNSLAAVSNEKGEVAFNATVGESYTPEIANMGGWTLLQGANSSVLLTKNIKQPLPLVKTNRLSGEIKVSKSEYITDGVTNLAGIRVIAVAIDDENVRFQTSTNNDGVFNLYLPEAKYKVYVDTKFFPVSVENNEQIVSILKDVTTQHVTFLSKDIRRSVEVKRL